MTDRFITSNRTNCQRRSDSVALSRSFPCERPGCGKIFTRKAILQDHLNGHDDKKPWPCDYIPCTKAFVRKNDMRRHYATHTGAGKLLCQRCERWFSRKNVYVVHKCNSSPVQKQRKTRRDALPIEAAVQQHKQQAEMLSQPTPECDDQDLHAYHPVPRLLGHFQRDDQEFQVEMLDELCQWPLSDDTSDIAQNHFDSLQGALDGEVDTRFQNPLQHILQSVSRDGDLNVDEGGLDLPPALESVPSVGSDFRQQTTSPTVDVQSVSPPQTSREHELQCFLCDRKHIARIELEEHLGQHRRDCNNLRRYTCIECEMSFHHHFELEAHRDAVRELQTDSGICNCCKETFEELGVDSHRDFARHLRGNNTGFGISGNSICYHKRMAQDREVARQIEIRLVKALPNPLVRFPGKVVRTAHFV